MSAKSADARGGTHIFRRLMIGGLSTLMVLGLVAIVVVTTRISRMNAKLDEIRRAGDPVSIADLTTDPPGKPDQAVTHLLQVESQAVELINGTEALLGGSTTWNREWTDDERERLDSLFGSSDPMFATLAVAQQCPKYGLRINVNAPSQKVNEALLSEIGLPRSIARVNHRHARYLTLSGRPDEAVTVCLGELQLCRLQDEIPTLVASMVNAACRRTTLTTLAAIMQLHDLSDASHEAIERELSKPDLVAVFVDSLKTERALGLDLMDAQRGILATISGAKHNYLDVLNEQIELTSIDAGKPTGANVVATGLTIPVVPAIDSARASHMHMLALTRCLRILNAIKQDGAKDLSQPGAELINSLGLPTEATTDPYTGQSLKVRMAQGYPLVYAVGPNRVDDEGSIGDNMDIGIGPP